MHTVLIGLATLGAGKCAPALRCRSLRTWRSSLIFSCLLSSSRAESGNIRHLALAACFALVRLQRCQRVHERTPLPLHAFKLQLLQVTLCPSCLTTHYQNLCLKICATAYKAAKGV